MPNARQKAGETVEEAKARYNAEMRDYRVKRAAAGKPLGEKRYDYRKWKDADLKRRYGIGLLQFEAMYDEQGGKCKICALDLESSKSSNAHLDHCHSTGRVRGILCSECNLGLGKFKDSPALLLAAFAYLQ